MRDLSPRTLRRFVGKAQSGKGITLGPLDQAYRYGRTMFASRVFDPSEVKRLLKDGHQSRKIGKVVMKGKLRGWPIYTLTLEERASCPRSCTEWGSCYGNRMQAAERITHGGALMAGLRVELANLAAAHPRGFLIRLHILGDFWSVDYVEFWRDALRLYPHLRVFGFTAHDPASAIGNEITSTITAAGWERFAVRFSGAAGSRHAARVLDHGCNDLDAIQCPAQTGATDCCATCALCWHSPRSIAFLRH